MTAKHEQDAWDSTWVSLRYDHAKGLHETRAFMECPECGAKAKVTREPILTRDIKQYGLAQYACAQAVQDILSHVAQLQLEVDQLQDEGVKLPEGLKRVLKVLDHAVDRLDHENEQRDDLIEDIFDEVEKLQASSRTLDR